MAQSQPFLGRLQPFYDWYIQVGGNAIPSLRRKNIQNKLWKN